MPRSLPNPFKGLTAVFALLAAGSAAWGYLDKRDIITQHGRVVSAYRDEKTCGENGVLYTVALQNKAIALCYKTKENYLHYLGRTYLIGAVERHDEQNKPVFITTWDEGLQLPLYDDAYDTAAASDAVGYVLLGGCLLVGGYVWYLRRRLKEEKRRYAFRSHLQQIEETAGDQQRKTEFDDIEGIVRVYYNAEQGRHFTYDGREVEVTPIGEPSPRVLNFHWSNWADDERIVVAKNIFNDAQAFDGNAFMLAKTDNVHKNNLYGYAVVRAEPVATPSLEARVTAYQRQPDGQLLPHNSTHHTSI